MHIKHILLSVFTLIISVTSFAQSAEESKLMEKICNESCTALENAGISDKDSKDDINIKLGLALISVYNTNSNEIQKVFGLDVSKPEDAEKFGQKIGAELVFRCPFFMELVMKTSKEGDLTANSTGVSVQNVSGTIERIECNELCAVILKTAKGEQVRLYRLEGFKGSAILDSFKTKAKKVNYKVFYKEISIYLSKSKSYETVKVITGIE